MATSLDLISGGLKLVGIKAAESPIEAAEAQDGLIMLNDMMAELEEDGIKIGYITNTDVNATLYVPDSTHAGIKALLAVRLAVEYGKIVSPALATLADGSMRRLSKFARRSLEVAYPSTLPMGSGNDCDSFDDDRFFGETTDYPV